MAAFVAAAASAANPDAEEAKPAAVVLNETEKDISSREGMKRTVETSKFYEGWLTGIPADIEEIKAGIKARDFNRVGAVAEANCLKMHATTLGAKPPFTYWTDATMRVMQTVQKLRKEGISAYFTIDAGPNVKVLYQPENEEVLEKTLKETEGVSDVILSRVGAGISYL